MLHVDYSDVVTIRGSGLEERKKCTSKNKWPQIAGNMRMIRDRVRISLDGHILLDAVCIQLRFSEVCDSKDTVGDQEHN